MSRYWDRDWLYSRYVEDVLSSTQIADMCGVTPTTICDWLHRHGIETRDPGETMRMTGVLAGENNPAYGDTGRISGDANPMRDPDVAKRNGEKRRGNTYPQMSAWQMGEDNPNWNGGKVPVECVNCCEVKRVPPNKADRRKFCSNGCQGEYWEGEGHPRWKGGYDEHRPPGWRSNTRPRVLKRDDFECQACEMSEEEHRLKIGQGLHVHHIKYGTDSLDDLITLCQWCHAKVTHGGVRLEDLLAGSGSS